MKAVDRTGIKLHHAKPDFLVWDALPACAIEALQFETQPTSSL
jgi:hypothetical protein